MRLATVHRCPHNREPRCWGSRNGKPRRKACPGCGGSWVILRGVFGVFEHSSISGSDRYGLSEALRTFPSESAAERHREQLDPAGARLVVRFIVTGR